MVRVIKENSVKTTGNDGRTQKQTYNCKECGYRSDRRFNVQRHAKRIHSKSISKKCCNILFVSKCDYYHHTEDHHPNIRSSCFISKDKYKMYGRRMKLSDGFDNKTNVTNTANSGNISDESTATRRSMRIQEKVMKSEKPPMTEISTESESEKYDDDDMDIDDYDYNESEESTHDLRESSICEENGSSDNSTEEYHKSNLDTIKGENIIQSLLVESKINVQENKNPMSRLPLKKRILCEINNDLSKSSIPKNEMKMNKISFGGKENHNPIDVILNKYQGTTIVKQVLTVEESMQTWNKITQRQRNYLKHIDFDLL